MISNLQILTACQSELREKARLANFLGSVVTAGGPVPRQLTPAEHDGLTADAWKRLFAAMPSGPLAPPTWDLAEVLDAFLTGLAHAAVANGKEWQLPGPGPGPVVP